MTAMRWFDLTPQVAVMRILALALIAAVHGAAQAFTARRLGDPGPSRDGRATLDPFAHLALLGSLLFVLFSAGWIRPVRLERNSLRGGAAGLLAVVALGLSAVLVLGWLSMLLRWPLVAALPDSAGMTADAFIGVFVDLCLWFVVVNVLPLPPLAAGALLRATETMDEDLYRKCARGGAAILIVAIAAGWLTAALAPLHRALAGILF